MKKLIMITTIFTLLMLLSPINTLAQQPAECEFDYTVQAGDWLSKIADKYYGNLLAFAIIVDANNASADDNYTNVDNPDLIEPGWLLCIPSDGNAGTGPQPAPEGLSQDELANATYKSEWTQDGTAPLVNGEYSEAAAPGSATMTKVMLTDNIAYGEIDGRSVAAAVLVTDPGGSGTFYDLAIVVNQQGTPANVASASLGDRVQINSVTVENNQIKVDMIQAGPNDPLCCPTQHVIKTFAMQGDQLVEVSSEEVAQAAGSGLAGTSWMLESVGGQPALPDAPATAKFGEDGTVSGTTGCNNYGAPYEVGGNNITVSPGPMTLMACPEPVGQQESAFMAALGTATTYQVQGDTLELLDADGNVLATFTQMESVALEGSSWTVISYNNGNQAVVSVIIGTELTANFGTDGNLTGNAGCNDYSAGYQTDGDSISFGPALGTQKFCGEPEGLMDQEQQYLAALQTAATYKIELDQLEMRTAEGSLVASFQATQ